MFYDNNDLNRIEETVKELLELGINPDQAGDLAVSFDNQTLMAEIRHAKGEVANLNRKQWKRKLSAALRLGVLAVGLSVILGEVASIRKVNAPINPPSTLEVGEMVDWDCYECTQVYQLSNGEELLIDGEWTGGAVPEYHVPEVVDIDDPRINR